MHMKIARAVVALMLGAGAAPGQAQQAPQEVPKWLAEAQAREARLPALVEVSGEDGWFRTRVPGAVKAKVPLADGAYLIEVPLEGSVAVTCELVRSEVDLAAFLVKTAEHSFEQIQKLNGNIEARAVEASEAGAIGPHPFMALQWIYRAEQKGERRVGALKQHAVDLGEAVAYCAHDDLGFAKTFEAVARALSTHLRTATPLGPTTQYREVSVVSLDGQRVGVATTTLVRDSDGDTQVVNRSSIALQAAPGRLLAQDVADVQWVRPDRSLINARQFKAVNGTMAESMDLKPDDAGRWRATGTLNGKAIDVAVAEAPASLVAMAYARRQLMARPDAVGARTEALAWSSLDLTRLLPSRATVLAPAGAEAFAVREEIGGVAIEAVLDRRTGTMASGRMPMGPRTLLFQRIFSEGEF